MASRYLRAINLIRRTAKDADNFFPEAEFKKLNSASGFTILKF